MRFFASLRMTSAAAAIVLAVACGPKDGVRSLRVTTSTEAGLWENFPVAVQSIFAQNVIAVIFVIALILNLALPKDMDNHK